MPQRDAVCVINYKFWQRNFQGDPNIAGKTMKINDRVFTIVGVAPKGFIGARLFSFVPDVWVPTMMQKTFAPELDYFNPKDRANRWMTPWARLKPGVSLQQAQAALNTVEKQARRRSIRKPMPIERGIWFRAARARMRRWWVRDTSDPSRRCGSR